MVVNQVIEVIVKFEEKKLGGVRSGVWWGGGPVGGRVVVGCE